MGSGDTDAVDANGSIYVNGEISILQVILPSITIRQAN